MSESKYCLLGRLPELENKNTTLEFYKYNQKMSFGCNPNERQGELWRHRKEKGPLTLESDGGFPPASCQEFQPS